MRIGLIRHFPVEQPLPTGWNTAADLIDWLARYDQSKAIVTSADLGGGGWQACLASDLPRAMFTARTIYGGEIESCSLLREQGFARFNTGNLRLPVWVWQWVVRAAWLTGHRSQRDSREEFLRRVLAAADRLCAQDCDTLVVSHAGMMAALSAELRRRGFAGPKLRIAKHATVYTYERGVG